MRGGEMFPVTSENRSRFIDRRSRKKKRRFGPDSGYFLFIRRVLIQTIARRTVAATSTTRVAIGSHCETIDVGVYVGRAMAMLNPVLEKTGGDAVYPTYTPT